MLHAGVGDKISELLFLDLGEERSQTRSPGY